MNNTFVEFLCDVALMIAGYFLVCSAISYAIDYYFDVRDNRDNADSKDVEGGE